MGFIYYQGKLLPPVISSDLVKDEGKFLYGCDYDLFSGLKKLAELGGSFRNGPTTDDTWAKRFMFSRSCLSRTRRSVTTMTVSKIVLPSISRPIS
jgi:hypothetical protein